MVVPHFTYLDSQVLRSQWFGNLCVNVCYLCLTLELHVDCYDIRFIYISLPFRLLVCCVWFPLLRWSSILLMWADERIPSSGNVSRDAAAWWLNGFWDRYGAYSWRRPNSLWFFCLGQYLVLPLELLHFVLGSVMSLLFCYGYVWCTVYLHIPNPVLSEYLYMWHFIKLNFSIYLERYNTQ